MVAAAPKAQDVQVRVYDPGHKDYHNWDEREDHAYRHYLEERHEQYRKYEKLKRKRAAGLLELAAQPSGLGILNAGIGVSRINIHRAITSRRSSEGYNVGGMGGAACFSGKIWSFEPARAERSTYRLRCIPEKR